MKCRWCGKTLYEHSSSPFAAPCFGLDIYFESALWLPSKATLDSFDEFRAHGVQMRSVPYPEYENT